MIIKVLGSGCSNCHKLKANVRAVLEELSLEAEIIEVTDFADIAKYNVMKTPALVIDDKVVSFGKVNTVEEIKSLLG